jgi:hypothetical protein
MRARPSSRQAVADRRRRNRVMGVLVVLAVAAVIAVVAVAAGSGGSGPKGSTSRSSTTVGEISGVATFSDLGRNHVAGTVDYPQTPPVGGDHAPVWQNCGYYPAPVPNERGVHSMEHGAVWITYVPDLPAAEVAVLRQAAKADSYVLVSPYPGLPSPVVASAWGVQLRLPSATDARLAAFVSRYSQGPQTPEPGGPCSGGAGSPRG